MTISTSYLFDRAAQQMSNVQSRVVKSQADVASGKQVQRPSDAPEQAALIQRYKSLLARHENYISNMGLVKARLDVENGAIDSVVNLMFRAKELVVQASNDSVSATDRQSIATELQGLREQILSLANSQDNNGNYLFSGSRVGQPAFAVPADDPTASPMYQGDRTRMGVMIGDQRSLPINRAGADVFNRVVRTDAQGNSQGVEFFQSFDDMIQGVKSSSQSAMQRGNKELDGLLDGLLQAQADVGTDMGILEQQTFTLEDTLATFKASLASVEDLDYSKAITLMNKQLLSLEAAQSSFAKISQLSLFSYLR